MKVTILISYLVLSFFHTLGQNTLVTWQKKLLLAKHDTTRMICYSELSDLQVRGDSMFYYANKGLQISRKFPNHIVNAKLLNALGRSYEFRGNTDSAQYYYSLAYDISLKLKDDKQIKYTDFNRIILSHSPAEQISKLLKMLKKYNYSITKSYDKLVLFSIYRVIADKYIELNNINKGMIYLMRSRKYISTYKDSVYYNVKYSLLLATEAEQKYKTQQLFHVSNTSQKYKLFLSEIEKFTLTRKDNLANQLMTIVYGNYARILTYEKKYNESIYYINKATFYTKEVPELVLYMKWVSLGENYVGLGQYKKGIVYLQKALNFYKNSQFSDVEFTILKTMSIAFSKLGNHQKSYQYLEKALSLNENYYSQQQQQLSLEVEKQFELAEKQEQITTKELDNKLKEKHIEIATQHKNILTCLLILSLALLVWAIYNYIKQKQLGQLLEKQKQILEIQAQQLLDANETKDKIFAVLGHDLQSPISDLKTIIMLFQSEEITPSEVQDLIVPLTVKIESLQAMMNNILRWSLLELKYQNTSCQVIELKSLIERVIQQLQPNVDKKKIIISAQQQDVKIVGNTDELEIIIRNLLSNAIKFTPISGHIDIETIEKYQKVQVTIKDTGVGVPLEIQHNIAVYPTSKIGTAKEKGIGLGLRIVRDLTTKNRGLFSIYRNSTGGTTVSLTFHNYII